jgi:outer membrane protein insertion porin family
MIISDYHSHRSPGWWCVPEVLLLLAVSSAVTGEAHAAEIDSSRDVSQIVVMGNRVLSSGQILKTMGIPLEAPCDSACLEAAIGRVLRSYRDRGYLEADLTIEQRQEENGLFLNLKVREGPQYVIGEVHIEGNRLWDDDVIVRAMETRSGRLFSEERFRRDMDRILTLYEDRGYPYVQVMPGQFVLDSEQGTVDFHLDISEGPLVTVDTLRVRGNAVSRDQVLLRQTRIRPGDTFSQSALRRAEQGLEALPYIERAQLDLVEEAPEVWVVDVEVDEGPMTQFEGVVGYAPIGADQDVEWSGRIRLDAQNLMGTGRGARFNWERMSAANTRFQADYYEPWLLGWPVDGSVGLSYVVWDSSYTVTTARVDFHILFRHQIQASLGWTWESMVPDILAIPRTITNKVVTGFSVDWRQPRRNPVRGYAYRATMEYGRRRSYTTFRVPVVDSQHSMVMKALGGVDYLLALGTSRVLYLAMNGGTVRTPGGEAAHHDLIPLGGWRTLRGYREEQFRGATVGWATIEYRLLVGPLSRVFAFLDVGYYRQDQIRETKVGKGVGMRMSSRLGVLGVDYGLGEGDSVTRGKIHVGFDSSF